MYLEHFPNELDTRSKEIYANMRQPKHISYISAATENIQARYVSQWLRNDNRYKDGRHTAVVMCDENILLPVMHSLPNEADKVNITSGFPLGMTPVASLISLLFDLYTTGAMQHSRRYRTQYVDKVLAHPYAQYIADCIPLSPMGNMLVLRLKTRATLYFRNLFSVCIPSSTALNSLPHLAIWTWT